MPQSMNNGAASPKPVTSLETTEADERAAENKYVVGIHPGKGEVRRFYLVRSQDGWNLSFEEQDLGDQAVERLLFWPREKMVMFDFARSGMKQVSDTLFCKGKNSQIRKSAADYSPCNSNFKVEESIVFARVFAGVFTLGMSEIPPDGQKVETFKLDIKRLKSVLVQHGLDKQVSRLAYRDQFEKLSGRSSLSAFIDRYSNDDPDGLVGQARRRLAQIDANSAAMKKAKDAVGSKESFVRRFTPARPEKYCNEFSKDKEAYSLCKTSVNQQVKELAQARGGVEYRAKLCKQVSADLQAKATAQACGNYAQTGQCVAGTPQEKRVCDVLRMEI